MDKTFTVSDQVLDEAVAALRDRNTYRAAGEVIRIELVDGGFRITGHGEFVATRQELANIVSGLVRLLAKE